MPTASDRRRTSAALAALVVGLALLVWGLASRADSPESAAGGSPALPSPSTATFTPTPAPASTATPTVTPSATPRAPSPPRTPVPRPSRTQAAKPAAPPTFGPSTVRPKGEPRRVVVVSTSGRTLVDAKLVPDRLDADGVLAPPFGVAGWYAEKGWARPGWPGASILAGHINRRSPSVRLDTFGHLTKVRPGDTITVVYTSGASVSFTATASRAVSKKAVPRDDSIWDHDNPKPVLRLITCDPTTPVQGGHYKGNWVVWASLA